MIERSRRLKIGRMYMIWTFKQSVANNGIIVYNPVIHNVSRITGLYTEYIRTDFYPRIFPYQIYSVNVEKALRITGLYI